MAALEAVHFAERLTRELAAESFTHEALGVAFARRTSAEWEAWAAEHDLPIVAVRE